MLFKTLVTKSIKDRLPKSFGSASAVASWDSFGVPTMTVKAKKKKYQFKCTERVVKR